MSNLTTRFAARMFKRAADSHGKTTLDSEGLGDKCLRWSGLEYVAQKSSTVITVDSPERTPDGMLALESATQGALQEACTKLEDQALTRGSHNPDQVMGEAHLEAAADPSFLARLTIASSHMGRISNKIMLSSFVQSMEWDRPLVNTPNP